MLKHPTGLRWIERQLRMHDLRLAKLNAWRNAVLTMLGRCKEDGGPHKALDGTPDRVTLEYERDALAREIRGHEILVALGRDFHALKMLEKVAGDASLARTVARDPKAFAEASGVRLPKNLVVTVTVTGEQVYIRLDYFDRACAASLTFP
jgi:hypothetical protein